MKHTATSGERWELRRNYVERDLVPVIAAQTRWIVGQVTSCVGLHDHRSLTRGHLLKSSTVHLEGSKRNHGHPTLEAFPEIIDRVPDLLNLSARTQRDSSDTANVFSILMFGPFGRLGWHTDEEEKPIADDSISVTLEGSGIIRFKENDGTIVSAVVHPGDALYIDNSGEAQLRLPHTSQNYSPKPRLAFVD